MSTSKGWVQGRAFLLVALLLFGAFGVGLSYGLTLNGTWSGDWFTEKNGNFTVSLLAKTLYVDGVKYPVTNGDAQVTCSNGTWIAHGLPGDPATTGSIVLSLRGPTQYNATSILLAPTVLSSNSTHFQIEFLAWETVGWTLLPVTPVMNQTVWWQAMYKP